MGRIGHLYRLPRRVVLRRRIGRLYSLRLVRGWGSGDKD